MVIVATVRALKYNGGVNKKDLETENLDALATGSANLKRHVESMQRYGVPVVVAVNRFNSDTDAEIKQLLAYIKNDLQVPAFDTTVWANGGGGALDLADAVVNATNQSSTFKPLYQPDDDLVTKMTTIVQKKFMAARTWFWNPRLSGSYGALLNTVGINYQSAWPKRSTRYRITRSPLGHQLTLLSTSANLCQS